MSIVRLQHPLRDGDLSIQIEICSQGPRNTVCLDTTASGDYPIRNANETSEGRYFINGSNEMEQICYSGRVTLKINLNVD